MHPFSQNETNMKAQRMKILARLDRWLYGLEKKIVSSCMIVMATILLISVACRHLNIVMVGGEEIAQFTVVWLTFWGMALCARKGNHIVMSAVLDNVSPQRRKKIITGICLISGFFCLMMSVFAAQLTYNVFHRGQVSPALQIPIWYMYISTPVGFFLTGVYYLGAFLKNQTEKDVYFGLEIAE